MILPLGIRVGIWWNVALLAGSVIALPFDHRRILGLNPWIKPIKFEISILVFLFTVGLLLGMLAETGRWARTLALMGWGYGVAMIVENTIIAMQSARGVRSHMNFTTLFDGVSFGVMGVFIVVNTVLVGILLVLFCVTRVDRPLAELWGIRLGLGLMLAGSVEGFRMVAQGAHTVGAADGGPGVPFLNWSTQHGDLRVAHFFALHALQGLWLAGWLLSRTTLAPLVATGWTVAAAVAYSVFVWVLFAAAMAGRSVAAML